MRDIFFYINAAMQRAQCSSGRKLSEMLELSPNTIATYRRGNLPNDETMMKLAKIAGIDPYIALLDLNTWRTEGETKKAYQGILQKIRMAIFTGAIMTVLFTPSAAPAAKTLSNSQCAFVYYGKHKRALTSHCIQWIKALLIPDKLSLRVFRYATV